MPGSLYSGCVILTSDFYSGMAFLNLPTLFKISANGDSIWSRGLPDMFGNLVANDFLILPNDGFLVAEKYRFIRTDGQCFKIWIIEAGVDFTNLTALDNNLYAAACDSSFDQSPGHVDHQYMALVKFDATGNVMKSAVYDHGFENHACSLASENDDGFFILA